MADVFELIFQGDQEIMAYFNTMTTPVKQRKIMSRGHTKASDVILDKLRSNAPKLTGLLKKSMGKKRYSPTATGGNASIISVIGPRSEIKVSRERYLEMVRDSPRRSGKSSKGGDGRTSFSAQEEQQPAKYAGVQEANKKYTFAAGLQARYGAVSVFSKEASIAIHKDFKKSTAGKRRSRVR